MQLSNIRASSGVPPWRRAAWLPAWSRKVAAVWTILPVSCLYAICLLPECEPNCQGRSWAAPLATACIPFVFSQPFNIFTSHSELIVHAWWATASPHLHAVLLLLSLLYLDFFFFPSTGPRFELQIGAVPMFYLFNGTTYVPYSRVIKEFKHPGNSLPIINL